MIKKMSLPLQLCIVIALVFIVGPLFPYSFVRAAYTFSLLFKECLGFFLPAIVFSFILGGILSFKKNAPLVLGVLLSLIICSNILVSLTSFSIGKLMLPFLTHGVMCEGLVATTTIIPFFTWHLPPLIGSEKAMIAAVLLGMFFSFAPHAGFEQAIIRLKRTIEIIFNRFFIPLLPLYVLGFLLKLVQEGTLLSLFGSFGKAFLLVLLVQVCITTIAYFIAVKGKVQSLFGAMSNAFSSYLTAFSTMSSTAAIPVTVVSAEKNTGNRPLAQLAIPVMANVHLMGDAITVPIFLLVMLSLFLGAVPTMGTYFVFICYFCMAMLATSGVPGGGIIVILPILKSIFGFTPEMISIITALYLLQDSFGTACNVFGDGALTMIANNVLKRILR